MIRRPQNNWLSLFLVFRYWTACGKEISAWMENLGGVLPLNKKLAPGTWPWLGTQAWQSATSQRSHVSWKTQVLWDLMMTNEFFETRRPLQGLQESWGSIRYFNLFSITHVKLSCKRSCSHCRSENQWCVREPMMWKPRFSFSMAMTKLARTRKTTLIQLPPQQH